MIDSSSISLFLCKVEYNKINVLLFSKSVTFQTIQKLSSPGGESFSCFSAFFPDMFEIPYELLTQIASAQYLITPSHLTNLIVSVSIYRRYLSTLQDHSFL